MPKCVSWQTGSSSLWPKGGDVFHFFVTCTCSGKRDAAVAVTDKGRTKHQGVTLTLGALGKMALGVSRGNLGIAVLSQVFVSTGSCQRLLLPRPHLKLICRNSCKPQLLLDSSASSKRINFPYPL